MPSQIASQRNLMAVLGTGSILTAARAAADAQKAFVDSMVTPDMLNLAAHVVAMQSDSFAGLGALPGHSFAATVGSLPVNSFAAMDALNADRMHSAVATAGLRNLDVMRAVGAPDWLGINAGVLAAGARFPQRSAALADDLAPNWFNLMSEFQRSTMLFGLLASDPGSASAAVGHATAQSSFSEFETDETLTQVALASRASSKRSVAQKMTARTRRAAQVLYERRILAVFGTLCIMAFEHVTATVRAQGTLAGETTFCMWLGLLIAYYTVFMQNRR